jgi:hypothetical protein
MLLLYLKSGLDLTSGNEGFKVNKKDSSGGTKTTNVFVVAIGWILMLIGILFAVIPAILIARQCNPELKVRYSILAFFFADVYIFQWAIRKFLLREKDYCLML